MSEVTVEQLRKFRQRIAEMQRGSAGVLECLAALKAAHGDEDVALEILSMVRA